MFASNNLELPYYKRFGRQRGRGFGALSQVFGRTAIPFLNKYSVPAAERVGSDLLEFALPEIAEVVSCRENFKTIAKNVGRQTLRKQLGNDSRKNIASKSLQQNLRNKSVGLEETF